MPLFNERLNKKLMDERLNNKIKAYFMIEKQKVVTSTKGMNTK